MENLSTAMKARKLRYIVRNREGNSLRETDSRLIAWWVWFRARSDGATAHDRRSWVEDRKSWLRCGDLPSGHCANQQRKTTDA